MTQVEARDSRMMKLALKGLFLCNSVQFTDSQLFACGLSAARLKAGPWLIVTERMIGHQTLNGGKIIVQGHCSSVSRPGIAVQGGVNYSK